METLAYLHLVLTHQEFNQKSESQETSKPDNLGAFLGQKSLGRDF